MPKDRNPWFADEPYECTSLSARIKSILTFQWLGRIWQGRYAIRKLRQKDDFMTRFREWLGQNRIAWFRAVKERHGRIDAVWIEEFEPPEGETGLARAVRVAKHGRGIPHPVHFREGMQVRNWLRAQPETEGWTDHEYDDRWVKLVEEAIK